MGNCKYPWHRYFANCICSPSSLAVAGGDWSLWCDLVFSWTANGGDCVRFRKQRGVVIGNCTKRGVQSTKSQQLARAAHNRSNINRLETTIFNKDWRLVRDQGSEVQILSRQMLQ